MVTKKKKQRRERESWRDVQILTGKIAPPGYPKTCLTSWAFKKSYNISAPVIPTKRESSSLRFGAARSVEREPVGRAKVLI